MSVKRFFTVKEFAEAMGLHQNTIYKGIKEGKIVALRLTSGKNSTFRIPVTEIERIAEVDLKRIFDSL